MESPTGLLNLVIVVVVCGVGDDLAIRELPDICWRSRLAGKGWLGMNDYLSPPFSYLHLTTH